MSCYIQRPNSLSHPDPGSYVQFITISAHTTILFGLMFSTFIIIFFFFSRWFSPDTPTSSTTKTGHHDIAEILLKVALSTKN
jgi:hypothetical protein